MAKPDPVPYKFRFGETDGGWDDGLSHDVREKYKEVLRFDIYQNFKNKVPTWECEEPAEVPHENVISEWVNKFGGAQKYFVDFTQMEECCIFIGKYWFSCAIIPFLIEIRENVIRRWTVPVEPEGLPNIDIPMSLQVEWLCEEF